MGNWSAASGKGQTSARGIFHLSAHQATSARISTHTHILAPQSAPVPALCRQTSLLHHHHALLYSGTNAGKAPLAQTGCGDPMGETAAAFNTPTEKRVGLLL